MFYAQGLANPPQSDNGSLDTSSDFANLFGKLKMIDVANIHHEDFILLEKNRRFYSKYTIPIDEFFLGFQWI